QRVGSSSSSPSASSDLRAARVRTGGHAPGRGRSCLVGPAEVTITWLRQSSRRRLGVEYRWFLAVGGSMENVGRRIEVTLTRVPFLQESMFLSSLSVGLSCVLFGFWVTRKIFSRQTSVMSMKNVRVRDSVTRDRVRA